MWPALAQCRFHHPPDYHSQIEARDIPISTPARAALQALLRFRAGEDSPVCPDGMTRGGYRESCFFDRAMKAKLSGVTWHSLRQTCISRAVMKGIDAKAVYELAGYKTITVTDRYAHLAPNHLREAAERADSPLATGTRTGTEQVEGQTSDGEYAR